jgi:hypothetical protein
MQAITVRDRDAGVGGITLTDMPYPRAGQNDVIVRVHAAGFTPGELEWPTTWVDRAASPAAFHFHRRRLLECSFTNSVTPCVLRTSDVSPELQQGCTWLSPP